MRSYFKQTPEEMILPARSCRYCQRSFQPSKYRPDQGVCSHPDCQRRRRAEYHRAKMQSDSDYAMVVRDSQKKWRDAHPDYQKRYWRTHERAAERNRHLQPQRDRKRHLAELVKNNVALDLKHSAAEVWLIGEVEPDLVKNNLASSRFLIVQPLAFGSAAAIAS